VSVAIVVVVVGRGRRLVTVAVGVSCYASALTKLLCCIIALTTATIATAQPRDYVVDVWDTDRGLPSSLVTSLAQTPEGYLWVATQNGLLRFDGLRFVAFDPDTTPQLPHARVEHLFVDAAGTLWINTYDGSITSWREGVFRREWTGSGPRRFEAFLAVSNAQETAFVLDTGVAIRRARTSTAWQSRRPCWSDCHRRDPNEVRARCRRRRTFR
jgi:ligand-binding sensor domain-containing protein